MSKEIKTPCLPIIQWAGGKRQLLPIIKDQLPNQFDTYYEPFLGGGALFFELQPKKAIINDSNTQLINVYVQIRKDYKPVILFIDQYQNTYNTLSTDEDKKNYYYSLRNRFNEKQLKNEQTAETAALFIFLNRSCFNALYRVNKKGEFNSPVGRIKHIDAYDLENVRVVSKCLSNATILNKDFEEACKTAKEGDFVFFDSPYYGTFDTYQSGGFSEEDHKRLAALFLVLTEQNVNCMLTNSNTDFIKDLYSNFNIDTVSVKRHINSDATNRVGEEIIVTNYKTEK